VSDPDPDPRLGGAGPFETTAPAGMDGMDGDLVRLREVIEFVAKELMEEAMDAFLDRLEVRVIEESRLVRGEGASSSSLRS
jgi:hypothetical protein